MKATTLALSRIGSLAVLLLSFILIAEAITFCCTGTISTIGPTTMCVLISLTLISDWGAREVIREKTKEKKEVNTSPLIEKEITYIPTNPIDRL